jgi:hypothetical protein
LALWTFSYDTDEGATEDSTLPCFAASGEQTAAQLRERFQQALTHSLVEEHVDKLIDTSLGSTWTRLYDSVSLATNIPYSSYVDLTVLCSISTTLSPSYDHENPPREGEQLINLKIHEINSRYCKKDTKHGN